ncbi:MAG: protein kinase domain-containing protein [Betaproteobacteria bacterium]
MSAAPDIKRLGRYDIDRVLGKGAMGMVYAGIDPRLHRTVAIKTILKSALDADTAKEYSMRFVREAQAVARLNHANIVQVYDFGEEGDIAYIVMEFIKGKELKNFFDASERFDIKEAVRIMAELCDALHFAHEAGIVHRDIKPANVMIDTTGKVKLADFGVARITDSSSTEKTQAGTMVGTPAYMSPEQITGGSVDRRSDIFSAGIILYQFLTGEKPFTGSGAWTIAKKIIQDNPPVPSSINKGVSALFDAVVNKALAKSVEARYQTARDLGLALKRALEGHGEEDDDKTVVGSMSATGMMPVPQMAAAKADASARTNATASGTQEVELEFWRSIKDGNDPDDFELYVQQFPAGIYAALAKRKIAKLRGVAPEETGAKAREQEKKELEEAARKEEEARTKLADEKAKLEQQLAEREAEFKKREAEAEARRIAAEKARAEQDAKREAEMKAKAEADAKARALEIEKARKDAESLLAKREAEAKARYEAEMARRDVEAAAARAKAEAEAKARRETEEKARKEAEVAAAKARAEAEARAKKQTEELAKAKADAEERAKKEAEERTRREAEHAKREAQLKKELADAPKGKIPVIPIVAGFVLLVGLGGGAWYYLGKEARERQAQVVKAFEDATKATEELKQAQAKQLESLKAFEQARAAEEAARKAGDTAKLKEAQDAAKRAEAEMNKQAELVKQRQAAAAAAAEAASKAKATADKQSKAPVKAPEPAVAVAPTVAPAPVAEPAKPEPTKQETVAAVSPGKAPATKSAAPAKAPTKTASLAPGTPAPSAPAIPIAEPKSDTVPQISRREREELEQEAQRQAELAAKAQASGKTQVAALDPMVQGRTLEEEGKFRDAVRVYRLAARKGSGPAAKRLGEIYDKGVPGVGRDLAESLQWYEAARLAGESVPTAARR